MATQRSYTPDMYYQKKFGRLYVTGPEIRRIGNDGYKERMILCKCDCGSENIMVSISRLMRGECKSCGCLFEVAKEKFSQGRRDGSIKTPSRLVHGDSLPDSPYYNLHHIWIGMRRRCNNPNDKSYPDYGAKGIKVCQEWDTDYRNFKEWALNNGYILGLSIDRIDNSKGYCPENCRWSSDQMQANNKSNNTYITYNGETHTKSEWSKYFNLSYGYGFDDLNKRGSLTNEQVVERLYEEKQISKPFIIVNEKQYEEGNKKWRNN